MKKLAIFYISFSLVFGLFLVSFLSFVKLQESKKDISKYIALMEQTMIPQDTLDSWDVFYLALTFIESSWNPNALNEKSGALGLIQCMPMGTPGYIDEANRLLKCQKYDNLSRIDPIANREIFDIVNFYNNPNLDFEKAIKMHNPRADESYRTNILKKYDELVHYFIFHPSIVYLESKDSCKSTIQRFV